MEEATNQFKLVQSAWEVLSNEQERSWYDSHREQILRGGKGGAGGGDASAPVDDDGVDISPLFNPACFDGFSDEPGSFFQVYAVAFDAIFECERSACENGDVDESSSSRVIDAPCFGDSKASWSQVKQFYAHWTNFISVRSFSWVDKWNLTEGPNRLYRRAMAKENQKERDIARKEYVTEIRELVDFVKRRDPRWAAGRLRAKQEELQKAEEAQQAKERAEAARAEQRRAWQAELEQREAEMAAARAEAYGDESDHNGSDQDSQMFECVVCDKMFKSAKQLQNHEQSKKHRDALAVLRRQLDAEEREMLRHAAAEAAEAATNEVVDDDAGSEEPRKKDKKKKKSAKRRDLEQDSDHNYTEINAQPDEQPAADEDVQDDVAIEASEKKKKKKKKQREVEEPDESTVVEVDATDEEPKVKSKKKKNRSDDHDEHAEQEVIEEDHTVDQGRKARRKKKSAIDPDAVLDEPEEVEAEPEIATRKKKDKKKKKVLSMESDADPMEDDEAVVVAAAAAAPDEDIDELAADLQATVLVDDDVKKKRRAKGKKAAVEEEEESIQCKKCKEVFTSRTKLFDHLKQNPKHAALK
jgi:DnaJ family protein A protein 5